MKSLHCFALLLLLMFVSCDKSNIAEKYDKFTDNRWYKKDVKEYEFTITDTTKVYNVFLDFTHVDGYQFASVPIKIDIEGPDKTVVPDKFDLKIKDENGKQTGECSGDYCDIEQSVLTDTHLKAGHYKLKVSHNFPGEYLPNVIGIGIKVNTAQ